jgi:hypothetical protein
MSSSTCWNVAVAGVTTPTVSPARSRRGLTSGGRDCARVRGENTSAAATPEGIAAELRNSRLFMTVKE